MARCRYGREPITQDVKGGPWRPEWSESGTDDDHDNHEPLPMVVVEPVYDDSELCDSCAWLSNVARYRVNGSMLTCEEHVTTTLNLAFGVFERE